MVLHQKILFHLQVQRKGVLHLFLNIKNRQIDAPGVILSGTKVTINADVPVSNNVQELEVQAITLYSSEYGYHNGSLIAVNKKLICYTVKGILSQFYFFVTI